jgi:hypothetical protein
MRVSIGCAVLAAGLLSGMVSAQEAKKKPQTSEASKKTPGKEDVKVYTNADLEKMFGIVAEEDREQPPVKPPATAKGSENVDPKKAPDPLTWLRQRQDAQREHQKAVAAAEAAVTAAKQQVTNLDRQLLAARNPFSARPELSDEEKVKRQEGGESAGKRYERTQELVEKAREAVRAAESELARLRAERP